MGGGAPRGFLSQVEAGRGRWDGSRVECEGTRDIRYQKPAEHLLYSGLGPGWGWSLQPVGGTLWSVPHKPENRSQANQESARSAPVWPPPIPPAASDLPPPPHHTWAHCTGVPPSLGVRPGVPAPGCPDCGRDCGPRACCVGRAANTLSHCSLLPICMWLLCLAARWS